MRPLVALYFLARFSSLLRAGTSYVSNSVSPQAKRGANAPVPSPLFNFTDKKILIHFLVTEYKFSEVISTTKLGNPATKKQVTSIMVDKVINDENWKDQF